MEGRKKKSQSEDSGTHVPRSEIPPGNYTVCHGNSLAIGPRRVLKWPMEGPEAGDACC